MHTGPVQPIIVNPDAPENLLIRDAAVASLSALVIESEMWEPWFAGKFTKTVRKVKASQLETWCEEWGWERSGFAAAGAPMFYEDFPGKLSKARVEGWAASVHPWDESLDTSDPDILITMNSELSMTPGKACAQAAHALVGLQRKTQESLQGLKVKVVSVPFSTLTEKPDILIVDSGLTEIAPGSATAFAVLL